MRGNKKICQMLLKINLFLAYFSYFEKIKLGLLKYNAYILNTQGYYQKVFLSGINASV
jgi:hypothetical protein